MTQKTTTRQEEKYEKSGFPTIEDEYESTTDINQQMIQARDEWTPSEKPEYDPNEDARDSCKSGKVRSIDKKGNSVRFGLDMGGDELQWYSVENSGEMNLDNEYVKLCRMYGVNPESVQDFYNKELYVKTKYDSLFVSPSAPVIRQLWNLQFKHHKHGMYRYKQKSISEGLVPNWNFIATHLLAFAVSVYAVSHTALALVPLMAFFTTMSWGLYTKAKYDFLPYIGEKISYWWEIYSHKNAT